MFSPWLIVTPQFFPPVRGGELKERLQLLLKDGECQKPAGRRGSCSQRHFPGMENVALMPLFPFSQHRLWCRAVLSHAVTTEDGTRPPLLLLL